MVSVLIWRGHFLSRRPYPREVIVPAFLAQRVLRAELLDHLPPSDPAARQSRRDLRRINALMGNARWLAGALEKPDASPIRILELGAGDGRFSVALLRLLHARWGGAFELTLLDQADALEPEIWADLDAMQTRATFVRHNVTQGLSRLGLSRQDIVVCNLFLHHFEGVSLRNLLREIGSVSSQCAACEPRRAWFPWLITHLVWMVGCNQVTLHDARWSVRAGFRAKEITRLWPAGNGWRITERPAGLFSHLFAARRDPAL